MVEKHESYDMRLLRVDGRSAGESCKPRHPLMATRLALEPFFARLIDMRAEIFFLCVLE